jgi:phosphoribosylanthranilate isomerase
MTFVKICGLTNREDAIVAAEAGADYLGFILWPKSPRAATLETAAAIVREIRSMGLPKTPICVGVHVAPSTEDVLATLRGTVGNAPTDSAIMDYVQLHKTPPDQVRDLRVRTNNRVFVALQPQSQDEIITAILSTNARFDDRHPEAPQMLVDAYHPTLVGGTGKQADLDLVRNLPDIAKQIMLAGGLTPDNIAETLAAVHPWAVDVASGTEQSPGKKDHGKVRAFIQAVRAFAR